MAGLPDQTQEVQEQMRRAKRAFAATMEHARIHLARAAAVNSQISSATDDAARTREPGNEGDDLQKAQLCLQRATDELFDAYAVQYGKALCPHSDKLVELLPQIVQEVGLVVEGTVALPTELKSTLRETINQKATEWIGRVTQEWERLAAQTRESVGLDKIEANFRRQYARCPERRVALLEALASQVVSAYMRPLLSRVTDSDTYTLFVAKIDWARLFIGQTIAFLDENDQRITWQFIEAECKDLIAQAKIFYLGGKQEDQCDSQSAWVVLQPSAAAEKNDEIIASEANSLQENPQAHEAAVVKVERKAKRLVSQDQQRPKSGPAGRKPVRRNARYEGIDSALREISQARPKNHEEIVRFLDDRKVARPGRKVFRDGWLKGFQQNRPAASAWLSQAWARLGLPSFPRGPKK